MSDKRTEKEQAAFDEGYTKGREDGEEEGYQQCERDLNQEIDGLEAEVQSLEEGLLEYVGDCRRCAEEREALRCPAHRCDKCVHVPGALYA